MFFNNFLIRVPWLGFVQSVTLWLGNQIPVLIGRCVRTCLGVLVFVSFVFVLLPWCKRTKKSRQTQSATHPRNQFSVSELNWLQRQFLLRERSPMPGRRHPPISWSVVMIMRIFHKFLIKVRANASNRIPFRLAPPDLPPIGGEELGAKSCFWGGNSPSLEGLGEARSKKRLHFWLKYFSAFALDQSSLTGFCSGDQQWFWQVGLLNGDRYLLIDVLFTARLNRHRELLQKSTKPLSLSRTNSLKNSYH